jgi:hypothetical protein
LGRAFGRPRPLSGFPSPHENVSFEESLVSVLLVPGRGVGVLHAFDFDVGNAKPELSNHSDGVVRNQKFAPKTDSNDKSANPRYFKQDCSGCFVSRL